MCDNCKDNNLESTELPETESPLSSEQDLIIFCEPIMISTENIENDTTIQLDKDEFNRGLKDASYFSGMYTGLINSGMSMEDSVALIFNFMNINHNIETTKITAKANIEVSKNSLTLKEKDML